MKIFFIILGCITLIIGGIGVILPILPTTPFLLVASFCFAKSSDRLNRWFKGTKLYQNNLESFSKGEGMTIKTKARILTTVTLLLAVAAYAMRAVPYGFIIIGVVWFFHLVGFSFFIKTKKAEDTSND